MTRPPVVPPPAESLPAALQRAADNFGHRGIHIYDRAGRSAVRYGYAEVHEMAAVAGRRWALSGVAAGDRVVVCLPTSWHWMEGWLGAIMRGALPVAAPAPGAMGSSDAQIRRVVDVAARIEASRVLCTGGFREQLRKLGHDRTAEIAITPEELAATHPESGLAAHEPDPDDVAFLQLTSGSTGSPRAVMIPHRAVMHNNSVSNECIGIPYGGAANTWCEAVAAWLPLYHDMGLIGCLWLAITSGYDLHLLEPRTFLARPGVWLDHLSRHGVCLAPAPNFAYQLCVERLRGADLSGVDLSGWRAAMTGAEMIQPETTRAFCETFGPYGFKPEHFRPCYGLAEGTLAVTFDTRGEGARTLPAPEEVPDGRGSREVVCTGVPVRETEVRIAAPDGSPLPPGRIGEVRAKGPGIFAGYFNDPEATAEGLQDGWLCTGDLGFLDDGELYLTGRVKDLLIIRGQNIMPHELEWLAEGVTGGGGTQRSGAFSIAHGAEGEQPVLVIESGEKDPARLAEQEQEIRRRIGRYLGLPLADLIFVRRGKIPKTTSGKVRRRELADLYREGRLERISTGG